MHFHILQFGKQCAILCIERMQFGKQCTQLQLAAWKDRLCANVLKWVKRAVLKTARWTQVCARVRIPPLAPRFP